MSTVNELATQHLRSALMTRVCAGNAMNIDHVALGFQVGDAAPFTFTIHKGTPSVTDGLAKGVALAHINNGYDFHTGNAISNYDLRLTMPDYGTLPTAVAANLMHLTRVLMNR